MFLFPSISSRHSSLFHDPKRVPTCTLNLFEINNIISTYILCKFYEKNNNCSSKKKKCESLMSSVSTYFLLMKPMNQEGKRPLLTTRGTWVSMNHFDTSSLSGPLVPSTVGSSVCSLCSILTLSCSKQHRSPVNTTRARYSNSLICLFSRRRQPGPKSSSVSSL